MRTATRAAAALLTAALALCALVSGAQNVHHGESFELSSTLEPTENHEYYASNYIDLKTGFHSEPNNNQNTILQLDPFGIFPPETGLTGGPHASDSGVVGSIGGVVDISASGGAIYSVPIVLPSDIGSIYPKLSVVYNSQVGNSLLGWGWGLSGISAITRVGHSLYHDDDAQGINFVDDRFALDGKRLMAVNNIEYGQNGAEYRKEVDDMTKIVSYRSSSDTTYGPAYFKVWTADGLIMEYGKTWDSRIGLKQPHDACIWLLNKVEDRNGNYMTYHYYKGSTEYRLTAIEYTGNASLSIVPDYSVNFVYNTGLRCDEETLFIGNNLLKNSKLLKSIVINYQNEEIARYDFDFFDASLNTSYTYHRLKTISYSCDGVSYNPTVIKWFDNDPGSVPGPIYYPGRHVIVDGDPYSDAFETKFKFTGDLNGDGFTDIIAIENVDLIRDPCSVDELKAHIYINTGPDNINQQSGISFEHIQTIDLDENVNWLYVADLNEDGKDDFVMVEREPGTYYDKIIIKPYLTYVTSEGIRCLQAYSDLDSDGYAIGGTHSENLLIGDFLGRGKNDIVLQIPRDKLLGVTIVKPKLLYITYDGDAHFTHEYVEETILPGKKFTAADFNGDGLTEIWCSNDGFDTEDTEFEPTRASALMMRMESKTSASQFNDGSMLSNWHQLFPGDFNGDGKTDLLTYVPDGNEGTWQINLFKENSLFWSQYDITDTIPINNPGNHTFSMRARAHDFQFIEVGDFNGDGKADLAVSTGPENTCKMYIYFGPLHRYGDNYLCKAAFSGQTTYTMYQIGLNSMDNLTLCTGNFYGKDNLSLISNNYFFTLPSMTNRYSVSDITDGMGNQSSFSYDYLMGVYGSDGFYKWDPSFSDTNKDILVLSLPIKAVKSLTTCNIFANTTPITSLYKYKSALVHKNGRGLIGFAQVTKELQLSNNTEKVTTSVYSTQNMGSHCAAALESVTTRLPGNNGKMLTKTTYENTFLENQDNGKVFIPVVLKQQDLEYSLDNNWLLTKTITENDFQIDSYHDTISCYYQALKLTEVRQGITRQNELHQAELCEFQSTTRNNYCVETSFSYENWIINRLCSTLFTTQRIDDAEISQSIVSYTYCNNSSYLPDTILTYPGADLNNEDGLATYTRFVYDNAGNVVEETLGTLNGSLAERPTYYTFDCYRFKASERNALGYTSSCEYQPKYGNLQSTTDINGKTTSLGRDNALETTLWIENPDRTKKSTAIRWIDDSGASTDEVPSNALYYVWECESGGKPVKTYYDAAEREIRNVCFGLDDRAIYQDTEYNSEGLIGRKSRPYFEGDTVLWTVFHYDMYHRPDTTHHPDGTMTVLIYNDLHTVSKLYPAPGSGLSPQVTIKALDAMKNVKYSIDPSGTKINYNYYSDGKLKSTGIDNHDNTQIIIRYDAAGNRTDIFDPDYGHSISVYNAYKELIMSITPKQDTTIYVYDAIGRNTSSTEIGYSDTTMAVNRRYYYETDGKLGLLCKEERFDQDGSYSIAYAYDTLQRVDTIIESINGVDFLTLFTYDDLSRVRTRTYPTGVKILNGYRNNILRTITDDKGKLLWVCNSANASGQISSYKTGNGVTVSNEYYLSTGRLASQCALKSGTIVQCFDYEYDDFGNLRWRKDGRFGLDQLVESFEYDQLNRLTHIHLNHDISSEIQYDTQGMGRMLHKEVDGKIVFTAAQFSNNTGDKPHAMTSASITSNPFPEDDLNITYSMFNQPRKLKQEETTLYYTYGSDHQRKTMRLENDGCVVRSKIYAGGCEFIRAQNCEKSLTFIGGPTGVFAVIEMDSSRKAVHYVYKDHLGSWTAIADNNGIVEQRLSFDAWGLLREPDTWTGCFTGSPMFDRGYTGHEHLYDFGLINMNGRIYDPVMSAFLSPDNYIQCPDNSQNFNRYAYCLNNPLRYTDPSGEAAGVDDLAIMVGTAVIVSVAQNGISNTLHGRPFFQNAGEVAFFALLQSTFSFAIGGLAENMGPGAFLFQAGAHATLDGVFTHLRGGDFNKGAVAGLVSSLFSSTTSVLTMSLGDTWRGAAIIASGTLSGGVASKIMGGDFIDGAINGFITAGLNHALHKISNDPYLKKLLHYGKKYHHHLQTFSNGCKVAAARSYYQYYSETDLGDAYFSTLAESLIAHDNCTTIKEYFEACGLIVEDGMNVCINEIGERLENGHIYSIILEGEKSSKIRDIDHMVTLVGIYREGIDKPYQVIIKDPLLYNSQQINWLDLRYDIKDAYFIIGLKQKEL